MSDSQKHPPYYIVDCEALLRIATTTQNSVKNTAFDMLKSGMLRVPTQVWDEFSEAYEDEAASIKKYVAVKIKNSIVYDAATASIVTKANSGFNIEPYGNSDWTAGAVAAQDHVELFTHGTIKTRFYKGILSCKVHDIDKIPYL